MQGLVFGVRGWNLQATPMNLTCQNGSSFVKVSYAGNAGSDGARIFYWKNDQRLVSVARSQTLGA